MCNSIVFRPLNFPIPCSECTTRSPSEILEISKKNFSALTCFFVLKYFFLPNKSSSLITISPFPLQFVYLKPLNISKFLMYNLEFEMLLFLSRSVILSKRLINLSLDLEFLVENKKI